MSSFKNGGNSSSSLSSVLLASLQTLIKKTQELIGNCMTCRLTLNFLLTRLRSDCHFRCPKLDCVTLSVVTGQILQIYSIVLDLIWTSQHKKMEFTSTRWAKLDDFFSRGKQNLMSSEKKKTMAKNCLSIICIWHCLPDIGCFLKFLLYSF